MKILLGVPEFPPYHIGGGGVVFESLAKEYQKLGHEVLVVYGYYPTRTGFEKIKEYSKNGIKFIQVPLLPTPFFLSFLKTVLPTAPRNLSRLTTIIKNFNPDKAHLHGYGLLFINQLAKILRKNSVSYIYTLHGAPVSADRKGGIIQKIYNLYKKTRGKAILDHANDITAVSQYTIDSFSEFQPYKNKIRVVYNGIYPQDFQKKVDYNIYDKFDLPKDARIYLSIGRIEWLKGFDQFIRMIPLLIKDGIDVRYFIAGRDNGYKSELDKLIKELKIEDRVFYLGFISGDDKLSALQNASYIVVPSLVENFPAVPLEAIASGAIPIVNKAGGMVEQIKHKENGLIVDFSKRANYVNLLNVCISSSVLEESIQKYEWREIAQEYLSYCL